MFNIRPTKTKRIEPKKAYQGLYCDFFHKCHHTCLTAILSLATTIL